MTAKARSSRPAAKRSARPKPKRAPEPARRIAPGLVFRVGAIAATLGVGAGLAAIPVGNWLDQKAELDQAELERSVLQAEISAIESQIDLNSGEEGILERGRCFGFWVQPGAETYTIPGVDGCVSQP